MSGVSQVPEGTLDAVLRRQLPALLRVAQPTHAVTLAALSIVEAYIVSRSELLHRVSDTILHVYGKLPM